MDQIGSKWIKMDQNGLLTSSSRSSSFSSSSSLPSDSGVVSLEVDSDEDSTEILKHTFDSSQKITGKNIMYWYKHLQKD